MLMILKKGTVNGDGRVGWRKRNTKYTQNKRRGMCGKGERDRNTENTVEMESSKKKTERGKKQTCKDKILTDRCLRDCLRSLISRCFVRKGTVKQGLHHETGAAKNLLHE